MLRIHDADKSEFLKSLILARVFANAAMDSRTWKIWRDMTRRLSPEHKIELAKVQHVRGIALMHCARVFRDLLPPEGREAYRESLHAIRAGLWKQRAAKRSTK